MKLKNNMRIYSLGIFTLTLLLIGMSSSNSTIANNGVPTRVLSGEYGNRINLLPCLIDTIFNTPCEDIYASASDSNYINHGWGTSVGKEGLGMGQPLTFQLFLDGEEIKLQKFAVGGEGGVNFWFYTVFESGDLLVGVHAITGIWSSKVESLSATTILIVSP